MLFALALAIAIAIAACGLWLCDLFTCFWMGREDFFAGDAYGMDFFFF